MKKHSSIKQVDTTEISNAFKELGYSHLIVIVDANVEQLYSSEIEKMFHGLTYDLYTAPAGETAKTFENYQNFCEQIIAHGVTRRSHLVAIGGGATSDFAGFLAATLLRGISWSVLPTTLLSMIDASIGGKVAINSSLGKNLIGSFHKPTDIYINPSFLDTLPEGQMKSGLGELTKYGLLSTFIFRMITSNKPLNDIIWRSAKYKEDIATEDPREAGIRKNLNLGHTLGHAFEKLFGLEHGIAVLHGLHYEILAFNEICKSMPAFKTLCSSLKLEFKPITISKSHIDDLVALCFRDKKLINNSTLEFVLPRGTEDIIYLSLDRKELRERLLSCLR